MKRNTLSIMPVRWVPIWVRASSFLSYVLQLEIRIELNCVVCDHGCRIRDICLRMIHGINLDEHRWLEHA